MVFADRSPPYGGKDAPLSERCMQLAENAFADRTPSHLAGDCGGRHRRPPMGGAAKGMPLNTRTVGTVPATPDTRPASVFTGSETAAPTVMPNGRDASRSAMREARMLFMRQMIRSQTHRRNGARRE